jgi:hypothetical protein
MNWLALPLLSENLRSAINIGFVLLLICSAWFAVSVQPSLFVQHDLSIIVPEPGTFSASLGEMRDYRDAKAG